MQIVNKKTPFTHGPDAPPPATSCSINPPFHQANFGVPREMTLGNEMHPSSQNRNLAGSVTTDTIYFTGTTAAVTAVGLTLGMMPAVMTALTGIGLHVMVEKLRTGGNLGPSSSWIGWSVKSGILFGGSSSLDAASAVVRGGSIIINLAGTFASLIAETRNQKGSPHPLARRIRDTLIKSCWPENSWDRYSTVATGIALALFGASLRVPDAGPLLKNSGLISGSIGFLLASVPAFKDEISSIVNPGPSKLPWADTLWKSRDWIMYAGAMIPYATTVSSWTPGIIALFAASTIINAGMCALRIASSRLSGR